MKFLIHLLLSWIPVAECEMLFPHCKEEAAIRCRFNRDYHRHLDDMLELYFWDESIIQAMSENKLLYEAWDALWDSKTEVKDITSRRIALFKLRGIIGEEAFLAGQMPPHVPLWRFTKLEYPR